MRTWLEAFINNQAPPQKQAKKEVATRIRSAHDGVGIFNSYVRTFNGNGNGIRSVRYLAVRAMIRECAVDKQLAFFNYLKERFPHWRHCQKFSQNNLVQIVKKMSSNISFPLAFYDPFAAKPLPDRFRVISVNSLTGRTAAVEVVRLMCSVHPDREAASHCKIKIPICHGCSISLGWGLKKGEVDKDSGDKKILEFLRSRRSRK